MSNVISLDSLLEKKVSLEKQKENLELSYQRTIGALVYINQMIEELSSEDTEDNKSEEKNPSKKKSNKKSE